MISAFAIAMATSWLIVQVFPRIGLVDRPGFLKLQRAPVATLGGVAVALGAAPALLPLGAAVTVPTGLALALGAADDVFDLPARPRLVAQVGIGLAAGALNPDLDPVMRLALSLLVVVLINAVNLVDGMDGLAGGLGTASLVGLAVCLEGDGRVAALAAAAALVGFLVLNRPPARLYLGNGGAYALGALLAVLVGRGWVEQPGFGASLGAAMFVALPATDVTVAIVRRRRSGRSIFEGDRSHTYDQLFDRGWSARQLSMGAAAVQLVFAVWGAQVIRAGNFEAFFTVIGTALFLGGVVTTAGFVGPSRPLSTAGGQHATARDPRRRRRLPERPAFGPALPAGAGPRGRTASIQLGPRDGHQRPARARAGSSGG